VEAIELFWDVLRQFLNIMLGYGSELDHDPLNTTAERFLEGGTVEYSNPAGYAECVIIVRGRVNWQALPDDECALFLKASENFDRLCERCGCTPDSGDLSGLRPPPFDDPHYLALKNLVNGRIATPAARAARAPLALSEIAERAAETLRPAAAALVRWLARRDGHEASLNEIAKAVFRITVVTDRRQRSARKRAERARDELENKGAPVRLLIHKSAVTITPA
jgi:hypothetical protein